MLSFRRITGIHRPCFNQARFKYTSTLALKRVRLHFKVILNPILISRHLENLQMSVLHQVQYGVDGTSMYQLI